MRLVDLLGESQARQFNQHTEREIQWVDHIMDEVMVVLIVAEVIMVEGAIMAVEDIIITLGGEDKEDKGITVEVPAMDHTLDLLE